MGSRPFIVLLALLLAIGGVPVLAQDATPAATPGATPGPATWGSSTIGDPYYPGLGNGGYDVGHYTLTLDLDVEAGSINAATALIEATATQDLTRFNLDFSGPEIDQVLVDGTPSTFWRESGDYVDELVIEPVQLIGQGADFTVEVSYHGRPNGRDDEFVQGWWTTGDSVFALGEPTGSEVWFPVNGHPLDKASYTFRITVPKPYSAIANGELVEVDQTDETATFTWDAPDEMASYLATFHAGPLVVERQEGPDGLPILNVFHQDISPAAREQFSRVPEMIEYFETIFGPYPFASFGNTVVNAPFPGALETQTMVIYGEPAVSESTVAHELAHQWFGDSVSLRRWQDIWLNEGFATYAQSLWLEHEFGREMLDPATAQVCDFLSRRRAGQLGSMLPIGDPGPDRLLNGAVYGRGALALHALRLQIGDDAFFDTLREWNARYFHGHATTDDFKALAAGISGSDLDAFFDAWLYNGPTTDLELTGELARCQAT